MEKRNKDDSRNTLEMVLVGVKLRVLFLTNANENRISLSRVVSACSRKQNINANVRTPLHWIQR